MGELVPCGLIEVLPGDSIQQATNVLLRVSPLLAPVMHPVHVRVHHFFVPHRIIWEDWEDFITGGPDGFNASVFPTIELTYSAGSPDTGSGIVGQLADYLGCPTVINNLEVSALPFRAYAKIWNEYFRDQDLQTELVISEASGTDTTTNTNLQNIDWEKDYFTSARPWTQKGPEVTIPLTGDAPVKGIGKQSQAYGESNQTVYQSGDTASSQFTHSAATTAAGGERFMVEGTAATGGFPNIFADLSGVSAANINELRLAFALQRYEEARARWGSRYVEYLRYLGVRSSDARLQRPRVSRRRLSNHPVLGGPSDRRQRRRRGGYRWGWYASRPRHRCCAVFAVPPFFRGTRVRCQPPFGATENHVRARPSPYLE